MVTITIHATPNAAISITQLKHDFLFGTCVSRRMFTDKGASTIDSSKYKQVLKDNFNCALPGVALKWRKMEREEGQVRYATPDIICDWCIENGLVTRGHCIFWAAGKYIPGWVKELDNDALGVALERRAKSLLEHYKGRIPEWDVNNEMLHADYFAERLGKNIRHDMFRWCKEVDPDVILYVNDFHILSLKHIDRYEKQIEGLLKAGVPLGGIGIQAHTSSPYDLAKARECLDRLAKFGLPLKITELTLVLKDEQLRSQNLVDFYRLCFAHPAVEAVIMWGFWEKTHWKKGGGFWREDWTPTPAAKAYRDLVYNQWWTNWNGRADGNGTCKVKVFYGKHKVVVNGKELIVELTKKEGNKELTAE